MWSTRGKQGFTLIGLLVVIAIVVLLMAVLLPTLQRVKRQAKAVVCQSNLRQSGIIWLAYMDDSGGYFPGGLRDEGYDPSEDDHPYYTAPWELVLEYGGAVLASARRRGHTLLPYGYKNCRPKWATWRQPCRRNVLGLGQG